MICKCSFCEYYYLWSDGDYICRRPSDVHCCPQSAITAFSDYLSAKNNPPNKSQVNTDEIVQEVLKKLLEKM